MDKVTDLANPLISFCQEVGLPREYLVEQEEPEWIKHYDSKFKREDFEKVSFSKLISLNKVYGDAFTCRFYFPGETLELSKDLNENEFNAFKSVVRHTPTFEFRFELDKSRLASKLESELLQLAINKTFPYNTFLFLFSESLNKFLSLSIEVLERILWKGEPSSKAILLIPEQDVYLNGPHLSIIGGQNLKNLYKAFTKGIPQKDVVSVYERCQELLRWKGLDIQYITPIHFKTIESSDEGTFSRAIYLYQAKLVVFYSADQTLVRKDGQYLAIFSGEKQRKEILVNDLESLPTDKIKLGSATLLGCIEWIYSSSSTADSLFLFQLVVVRSLQISETADSFRLFVLKSDYIVNELRWLWKRFAEGKIDGYLEQVKTLEDYVSTVIQTLANQISSMIKSLSDTMLAAIGVALASFIAALFKDNFDPTIFRIGVVTYAVYVLIFPLIYNMSFQRRQFNALCKSFNRRRRRFDLILDSSKVDEIIDNQFEESKKRFNGWFKLIKLTYIAVAIFAFAASIFVPNLIPPTSSSSPASSPSNTPKVGSPSPSPTSPGNSSTNP